MPGDLKPLRTMFCFENWHFWMKLDIQWEKKLSWEDFINQESTGRFYTSAITHNYGEGDGLSVKIVSVYWILIQYYKNKHLESKLGQFWFHVNLTYSTSLASWRNDVDPICDFSFLLNCRKHTTAPFSMLLTSFLCPTM